MGVSSSSACASLASSGDILINAQDASIGNNFVSQQIQQLPLESRNVVQLLSLQPGVTPDGYVTGSRADQANVTLDGVDVNEQQTGPKWNPFHEQYWQQFRGPGPNNAPVPEGFVLN